jgi:hypothetical protein
VAAPAFQTAGTFAGSASTASPGIPSGTVANDILLLFVESENETISLSDAQGFAELGTQAGQGTAGATTASRIAVFWKRATGSDAAPTVADAGDHVACRIGRFSGCITTGNPWDGTPTWTHDAVSDTVLAANGPTTTVADCLVVIGAANVVDTNTAQTVSYSNANLTGLGGTGMGDNTNQGTGGGLNVGTGVKASAGAVGATTCTWGANTQKSVVVLALKPVAASTLERSAAVDAVGAITVAATQFFSVFERAATVAASADIASSGAFFTVFDRAAAVDATAGIASSGEFETPAASHERSATLEATGAATVAAFQRDHQRQSAVAASGAVATAGQRDLLRSATVTATGAVATQAIRVHIRSTDVSASGTVTSTGQRDLLRAVALAATADIFTSGQIEGQLTEHNRSADLTATASIDTTAVFWTTFERTVALTATATTDTAGLGILERSAGLEATGAISSTGSLQLERAVAVSATALIETTVSAVEWSYGPLEGWSYQGGTASMYQGGTAFNYGPGQGWTYHGGD